MNNLQEKLKKLGFNIWIVSKDTIVMRTPNLRLIVIVYDYVEVIETNAYQVAFSNVNTINCFSNTEDLLEALDNYLHPENWLKKGRKLI